MPADALQDIDQIGVGVDPVQATGDDQALHDANVSGPEFGPAEHPVFPPHGDRAQRAFQMVGIDRHVRVGQLDLQPQSSFARIGQGPGQRMARQQPLRLELLIDPGEEPFDDRLGMHQAIVALPGGT